MGRCTFYQRTFDGERCVLMPPEEWRAARQRLVQMCQNEGRGCQVLNRYLELASSMEKPTTVARTGKLENI